MESTGNSPLQPIVGRRNSERQHCRVVDANTRITFFTGVVSCPGASFLCPQATLNPDDTLHTQVQDMLRGLVMRGLPLFDQDEVVALLDRLPGMDAGERTANDQVIMLPVSMCVLRERFRLSAGPAV